MPGRQRISTRDNLARSLAVNEAEAGIDVAFWRQRLLKSALVCGAEPLRVTTLTDISF